MRHRVKTTTFSRDTKHRKAMIRSGVENLVLQGHVSTSKTKAKEFKRWADKLIHKAQSGSLTARRDLHRFFGKRNVVNALVDKIAPLFADRTSGFTRITVEGKRRGDNTEMVRLELVTMPENMGTFANPTPAEKTEAAAKKSTAKKATVKKAAPAKKVEKTEKTEKKVAAPKKTAAKAAPTKTKAASTVRRSGKK
jgi:large subunit ribosomal protein L17